MIVFCIVHLHIIMLNLFMQNCVCLHRFIVIFWGLSHSFFTVLQASTVLPPYMGLAKAHGLTRGKRTVNCAYNHTEKQASVLFCDLFCAVLFCSVLVVVCCAVLFCTVL